MVKRTKNEKIFFRLSFTSGKKNTKFWTLVKNPPAEERLSNKKDFTTYQKRREKKLSLLLVFASFTIDPLPPGQRLHRTTPGGQLRRARTARSRCGEYTRNVLIVNPLPKGPLGRANALATKVHQNPSPPQTQRTQEHNTIGTRFAIVEMALGALWPFAVPGTPPPPLRKHGRGPKKPGKTAVQRPPVA